MCSRSRRRGVLASGAAVTLLLVLLIGVGCGRKGPPLPPLREPDPVEETTASEPAAAEEEAAVPEAELAVPDDDEGDQDDEDGDEDDDGPPP